MTAQLNSKSSILPKSYLDGPLPATPLHNCNEPKVSYVRETWKRPTFTYGKYKGYQSSYVFDPRKRPTPNSHAPKVPHPFERKPRKRQTTHFWKSRTLEVSAARFQDLGFSGLRIACDPRVNCVRKMFWGCLWLAALVWCSYEVSNCIVIFASSPFIVNVKYKDNHTIIPPLLTICPADVYYRNPAVSPLFLQERSCNTSYKNALQLLKTCNLTIDGLWNISRFEMKDPTLRLYQAVKWLDGTTYLQTKEIETIELKTIHGTCLMFRINIPLRCLGMQNGLDIESHTLTPNGSITSEYYMGVVHSEEEIPLIRYTGTKRNGFYAAYRQLTTVAIRVQQLIHVNTPNNPCQSDDSHVKCLLRCVEEKIISYSKLAPCRLPYMNEDLFHPPCKSEEEFSDMYEATQLAVDEFSPETCGCVKPCNKLHYREEYFLPYPMPYLFGLYLTIPHCSIEVIEDQLSYDFNAFLSDIGGSLGLFLGMSVFSILEIIEVLVLKTLSLALTVSDPV